MFIPPRVSASVGARVLADPTMSSPSTRRDRDRRAGSGARLRRREQVVYLRRTPAVRQPAFLLGLNAGVGLRARVISAMLDVAGLGQQMEHRRRRGTGRGNGAAGRVQRLPWIDTFTMAGSGRSVRRLRRRRLGLARGRGAGACCLFSVWCSARWPVCCWRRMSWRGVDGARNFFIALFLILGLVVVGEIAGVVLGRAVRGARSKWCAGSTRGRRHGPATDAVLVAAWLAHPADIVDQPNLAAAVNGSRVLLSGSPAISHRPGSARAAALQRC